MHISEGVLSFPALVTGASFSIAGIYIGLKKLEPKKMVQASVLSSSFFIASLIHIPIGFTNTHLILNGIVGLLLGWSAFPVIAIALFLQGIFFQFGGLTTLGVNTFVMAFPAVISFYIFAPFIKNGSTKKIFIISFLCGFFTVFLSGIFLSLALIATDEKFLKLILIILTSHLPIMIIEGFITAFCVSFLKKMEYL